MPNNQQPVGRSTYVRRSSLEAARRDLRLIIATKPPPDRRSQVFALYDVIAEQRAKGVPWRTIHSELSDRLPISRRGLEMYFAEALEARKLKR